MLHEAGLIRLSNTIRLSSSEQAICRIAITSNRNELGFAMDLCRIRKLPHSERGLFEQTLPPV